MSSLMRLVGGVYNGYEGALHDHSVQRPSDICLRRPFQAGSIMTADKSTKGKGAHPWAMQSGSITTRGVSWVR
jgi:hypothetical protein